MSARQFLATLDTPPALGSCVLGALAPFCVPSCAIHFWQHAPERWQPDDLDDDLLADAPQAVAS